MTRCVNSTPASKNRPTDRRPKSRATRRRLPGSLNPALVSPLQAALMWEDAVNLEADVALVLSSDMADEYAGPDGFTFEGEIYNRIVASGGDIDAKVAAYVKAVERTNSLSDLECEASDAATLAVAKVASMAEVDEVVQHAIEQGRRPESQGLTGLAIIGTLVDALASRLVKAGKASGKTLAAERAEASMRCEVVRKRHGLCTPGHFAAEIGILGQLGVNLAGRLFAASASAAD